MQTFKEGKPHLSFANINGTFGFRETMEENRETTIAGMPVQARIHLPLTRSYTSRRKEIRNQRVNLHHLKQLLDETAQHYQLWRSYLDFISNYAALILTKKERDV